MPLFAFRAFIVLMFIFLLAPMVVIVIASFSGSTTPEFPPRSLSLVWYAKAFSGGHFTGALINSLVIGILSTAISVAVGIATAFAIARRQFRFKAAIETAIISPLVVPGIVIGIALLAAFVGVGLRNSWWRLLLAHVLLTFPYCVKTVVTSLSRLDPAYEQAAETLGAAPWQTLRYIVLPLIRPGIIAGALFAFVISFDNVPVSIFLIDAKTSMLPIAIINYIEYNFDPSVSAISSVLIVTMLSIAMLIERMAGLKKVMGGS